VAKTFVTEIQPNQEVSGSFVVSEKQLRMARNGNHFLTLKLVDKTGEITGRVWDNAAEVAEGISTKEAVFLRARSETFRDELQLQIVEISPLSKDLIDPSDFLPVSPLNIESLFDQLRKLVSTIKKRSTHQLMKLILNDRELMDRFKLAPAAKAMHHAYLGGLLEHSVAVARLVSHMSEHYPDIDRDLLMAGAVLHDIGKVDEFVYDLCIDYSTTGRLIGHLVLGVQILDEKIRALKSFPPEEATLLKHLILSHHGETDLGAVRLPMTREAFVLHFADDLDAKMNSLTRILSDTKEGDASWTPYQKMYERFFFRGFPPSAGNGAPTEPDFDEEQGIQLNIWSTDPKCRP
jgi:3'-5' exoribonuclease